MENLSLKCLQVFFHAGGMHTATEKKPKCKPVSGLKALMILLKAFLFQIKHVNALVFYFTPVATDLSNYSSKRSWLVARLQPGNTQHYQRRFVKMKMLSKRELSVPSSLRESFLLSPSPAPSPPGWQWDGCRLAHWARWRCMNSQTIFMRKHTDFWMVSQTSCWKGMFASCLTSFA